MTNASPDQIRRRMRGARRALDVGELVARSQQLAARVADHQMFLRARRIACYLAVNGEMDPDPLLNHALAMGREVYLPVLVPYRHNRLWFAPYDHDTRLTPNRFGILEPQVSVRRLINPRVLDLVLMPLVAFDAQCNRLGMGGGYYDRTFGFLRHRRHWKKPRLLGVAYDFQRVPHLTQQSWDVPLDAVATDAALYLRTAGKT